MFQLALAEIIQADREREIAELVRQRQLLKPDPHPQAPDEPAERSVETRVPNVRTQSAGG
jgi:hypothetical protein